MDGLVAHRKEHRFGPDCPACAKYVASVESRSGFCPPIPTKVELGRVENPKRVEELVRRRWKLDVTAEFFMEGDMLCYVKRTGKEYEMEPGFIEFARGCSWGLASNNSRVEQCVRELGDAIEGLMRAKCKLA